ncbi:LysE family translocator [Pectobacterium betavasculorum]|uniref:Lysine transporter LysE n=1 Tax=Pectobacterium betavasculorum TaxID=55207 RepID=A0ABR4V038_9GAMM|nr:LysE family transporter [Pectobacterium betavasculorum]KFX20368.1 lysine transporter LysE [Pectobacterium betavasculorum]
MLLVVFTGMLLSLSLCLDLGMVNTAIINRGLRHGARSAFYIGLGSCFGDLFYATLSVLGLAVVFNLTPVRWALWIGGGLILIWMTISMARAAWRDYPVKRFADLSESVSVATSTPPARYTEFLSGVGMALASPTALLWFAAIGGTIIAQSTDGSAFMIGLFLLGFFVGGVLWTLFLAALVKYGQRLLKERISFYCSLISALLFAYFAWHVISHGYQTLFLPLSTTA